MHTVTHLALAHLEAPGIWRFNCGRCRTDLGTIATTELLAAIDANSERGGIMCPSCRQQACHFCGVQNEHKFHIVCKVESQAEYNGDGIADVSDWVMVCKLCYIERWEEIFDEKQSTTACLVVHNSTGVRTNA